jgi:hypothetical protein
LLYDRFWARSGRSETRRARRFGRPNRPQRRDSLATMFRNRASGVMSESSAFSTSRPAAPRRASPGRYPNCLLKTVLKCAALAKPKAAATSLTLRPALCAAQKFDTVSALPGGLAATHESACSKIDLESLTSSRQAMRSAGHEVRRERDLLCPIRLSPSTEC